MSGGGDTKKAGEGEEKIRQEDCSEDSVGSGILTLTTRRIAFDKSGGRIMDLSKRVGDTVIDVSLGDVTGVWKEGRFIKKVCFTARHAGGRETTHKFGVFSTGGWLEDMQDALEDYRNGVGGDDQ